VPEGAADFIAKVQKIEDGLIIDGVDDDLGDKFIWQQMHQAHHRHQGGGEEIEKRPGLEIERRRGLQLKTTRVEVGTGG
jgi:hypothetical protein